MSMSIEKALDKIADVLTNTTDDANGSIEYSLSVIADALANGDAKELPAVTASDNGDVLTVVEGAWAKAAPSAGGGCLYVTFSTEDNGTTWTADKTFAECLEAYENGSAVIAQWNDDGYLNFAHLSGANGLGTEGSPITEFSFAYHTYFPSAIAESEYVFKAYLFALNNAEAVRYRAYNYTIISASQ